MRYSPRLIFVGVLLLCGCASMTTTVIEPTDTERNSTIIDKPGRVELGMVRFPNADIPVLEVEARQWVNRKETYERQYLEKQVLKPKVRATLWLSGATVGATGFLAQKFGRVVMGRGRVVLGRGWFVLGRYVTGLGVAMPLIGEALAPHGKIVSEQWQEESRVLRPYTVPLSNLPLTFTAADWVWADTTDDQGKAKVDISTLTELIENDQPLRVTMASQEDSALSATYSIPADLLAELRPPPEPLLPFVVLSPSAIETHLRTTIAILDFEVVGVSAQEARILTSRLGTYVVQAGRWQVIERREMEEILREQDFQLTGCTSNECAVEIGRLLGCQRMLAGSIGKIESTYHVDMRVIDVETGGILRTASHDVQGGFASLMSGGILEAVIKITGGK